KNCPDKNKIGCNFCFRRWICRALRDRQIQSPLATNFAVGKISSSANLHPAVTYVYVSSLGCKFASLACRLSQRSASLLTLSTSWGGGCSPPPASHIRRCLPAPRGGR